MIPRIIVISIALAAGGCMTATTDKPLTKAMAGNDPGTQLDFWHDLAEHKLTSNNEAFHGLLLLVDGTDPADDYQGRLRILKDRKLLAADFYKPADVAVDRGTLAAAIAQVLHIRGGLTMRLVGPTPRYATKELEFLGIYPPSSPNQTFSGTEFVGIIGRVEDYQRVTPVTDYPAKVMPSQAGAKPQAANQ